MTAVGHQVTTLLAPNSSVYTGSGTNTYLIGQRSLFCIDPGPDDDEHLEHILAAARAHTAQITSILLTHSHPDHRPLAVRLAAATGADIRAFDPARGADGAAPLRDGERLQLDGVVLIAVHTPGHAGDHVCFFDGDERVLYSGDHVLGNTTTFIDPEDGDMVAYLASLDRVLALRPAVIRPGHGPEIADGVGRIEEYIEHRAMREQQILGLARGRGPFAPADLVPIIYAGYPVEAHPLAAKSVQAHLDKLVREGTIERRAGDTGPVYVLRS
jgi:glyoxylase-like metal-dependent hydrolase (beta-lactamase superfamily II)